MAAIGCGVDFKPLDDEKVTDYTEASCEYKNDQGDSASSKTSDVSMYESYFDKQIDTNLLYPLLNASATETIITLNQALLDLMKSTYFYKTPPKYF